MFHQQIMQLQVYYTVLEYYFLIMDSFGTVLISRITNSLQICSTQSISIAIQLISINIELFIRVAEDANPKICKIPFHFHYQSLTNLLTCASCDEGMQHYPVREKKYTPKTVYECQSCVPDCNEYDRNIANAGRQEYIKG
ncbi:hypothetical protein FGO68_gene17550 [Halteria grandinella]|uniref:Uncharacterized protein n=1 Tax=Halteria grandinella TaxID=5974 RepID=A0A8J8NJ72_HALGN|nr:hypothetical protein FGO68_gene17550 [Halteria grandinella]